MTEAPAFPAYYTNEVSEEFLRELRKPAFTEEELSTFNPEMAAEVRRSQSAQLTRSVIGIRRLATEGSESRLGGRVIRGTSATTITLDNGREVTVACKGDPVQYPDGSIAFIMTGAGKANSDIALVGSRLDNGDELINTPQDALILVMYEDHAWDSDFLPEIEGER
ncbi:PAAR domain-containing protein [Pseudomonas nicosulfuronedens]